MKKQKETLFFNNIRETYESLKDLRIFNSWFWKDWWYNSIDTRLDRRNKWADNIIPRQYSDKPELITNFLFAALINYVDKDGEDCFGRINWTTNDEHRKVAKQIKEVYKWAKYDRAAALEKLDKSYPTRPKGTDWLDWINNNDIPYKVKYKETIRIEKYIKYRDDKYLKMIISIKEHLWT